MWWQTEWTDIFYNNIKTGKVSQHNRITFVVFKQIILTLRTQTFHREPRRPRFQNLENML